MPRCCTSGITRRRWPTSGQTSRKARSEAGFRSRPRVNSSRCTSVPLHQESRKVPWASPLAAARAVRWAASSAIRSAARCGSAASSTLGLPRLEASRARQGSAAARARSTSSATASAWPLSTAATRALPVRSQTSGKRAISSSSPRPASPSSPSVPRPTRPPAPTVAKARAAGRARAPPCGTAVDSRREAAQDRAGKWRSRTVEARAPTISGGIAPRPGWRERPAPPPAGLTEAEARARLEREGPNELPARERHGMLGIVLEVVREPMFLLLVAAGALYLVLGEPVDALMLLGFVFVVMGITIVQERRTERALEALRDLSSPRALVIRDGAQRRIAGREVVRGDLLVLAEGDRVPADALLRRGINLSADESLLTGESVPVRKRRRAGGRGARPARRRRPALRLLRDAGHRRAGAWPRCSPPAPRTELGKIGKALQARSSRSATLLQQETGRLVRTFAMVGLAACAVVVVVYALTRGGGAGVWKQGLLAGITMAMATLPEEFPVVLTVFLALGRLADLPEQRADAPDAGHRDAGGRHRPVRRQDRDADPEPDDRAAGSAPTGSRRRPGRRRAAAPGGVHGAARVRHPGQQARSLRPDGAGPARGRRPAARGAPSTCTRAGPGARVPAHRPSCWRCPTSGDAGRRRGAWWPPRARRRRSPTSATSPAEARTALLQQAAAAGGAGAPGAGRGPRRARGRARCRRASTTSRSSSSGLVGLADPLRPAVPAAVAECRTAGIRVVMITGDYPATAQSIARQIGLATARTR